MSDTIQLNYPVTINGVETDQLTIRRPKVRDIKLMDKHKGDISKSIGLLSALCEVPPEAIEELDAEDFAKVSARVAGFMPSPGDL